MAAFKYTVTINADNQDEADRVISALIGTDYDELPGYDGDYISYTSDYKKA